MKLYDNLISRINQLLEGKVQSSMDLNVDCPELLASPELLLSKHSAFELGADGLGSVTCTLVTTNSHYVDRDEVILIGDDLDTIKDNTPFARLMLVHIDDISDDSNAYKSIRDIEYVKYDVIPRGYMQRTSFMDFREQVRVSKDAIKNGLSLANIGRAYISKLKSNPQVKHVKVVFVTERSDIFGELTIIAKQTDSITKTLNKVLLNANFDCDNCNLKAICDEVEGMKEVHFNRKNTILD